MFARSPYWLLFDDPDAFEEIFSIALLLFDKEWVAHTSARDISANPETPAACLEAVRHALTQLVQEHACKSTYDLREVVLELLPGYESQAAGPTSRQRSSSDFARTAGARFYRANVNGACFGVFAYL